ncbi:hypothetical protein VTI28DRAFT_7511 [Corynascus sepedonium]
MTEHIYRPCRGGFPVDRPNHSAKSCKPKDDRNEPWHAACFTELFGCLSWAAASTTPDLEIVVFIPISRTRSYQAGDHQH